MNSWRRLSNVTLVFRGRKLAEWINPPEAVGMYVLEKGGGLYEYQRTEENPQRLCAVVHSWSDLWEVYQRGGVPEWVWEWAPWVMRVAWVPVTPSSVRKFVCDQVDTFFLYSTLPKRTQLPEGAPWTSAEIYPLCAGFAVVAKTSDTDSSPPVLCLLPSISGYRSSPSWTPSPKTQAYLARTLEWLVHVCP